MTHLDVEIARLKKDMLDLFGMVKLQLEKSKQALIHLDKDLAREVMVNEKRVNAVEIKLDRGNVNDASAQLTAHDNTPRQLRHRYTLGVRRWRG